MNKTIVRILLVCFVLSVALVITGCSGVNSKAKDVVGVWKDEKNPDYATIFRYVYIYLDGTGDFYGYDDSPSDTRHCNPFEWQYKDGKFQIKGNAASYTVKGGKMYDKQGNVKYTLVSKDTSKNISLTWAS